MSVTRAELCSAQGVPVEHVDEIIRNERAINSGIGMRLSRALGLSDAFWTNVRAHYESAVRDNPTGSMSE